ncbi:MAG: TdeIII family type II restriction endonuclease [Bacteroidales bacterium]|nr:TdeIII family type II restriction endonuclease [Bacteroidales bacterium]
MNRLEHRVSGEQKYKPDWKTEIEYIMTGGGEPIPISVVCDILINSKVTNQSYSFELKGPLPNSDQTKVSKEKMLKLLAMREKPVSAAYYALPYNPYGKRERYEWSFPNRWFDMRHDPCVLIGEELWDMIGGKGTYQMFIKELNKIGVEYKERIYREYLGIEPPEGFNKELLK